ncbi:MAG: magnesium protoporphyrin IX methyltransferase [Burkholderiales bacterium]|jgi:magnesium-protoporphyrin O-methyltransferase
MSHAPYQNRRSQIEQYFDRTAVEAWERLTSSAPVSGIRATVRAGRDRMRATMLSWLPDDLRGRRVLDAGCGTGAMSFELARRGAEVLAIDLSPRLVEIARQRMPADVDAQLIDFRSGDMLDEALGYFDHVVAMDSLIHYEPADVVHALGALAPRTVDSMIITFAPRTPLLSLMHAAGKLFPRADRAPAIVPVAEAVLKQAAAEYRALSGWQAGRTLRVSSGFYTSQAIEWEHAG